MKWGQRGISILVGATFNAVVAVGMVSLLLFRLPLAILWTFEKLLIKTILRHPRFHSIIIIIQSTFFYYGYHAIDINNFR